MKLLACSFDLSVVPNYDCDVTATVTATKPVSHPVTSQFCHIFIYFHTLFKFRNV